MSKLLSSFPKVSLGFFPTPLTRLERLESKLGGPEIYIKRDDLTGLAFGGNKTRKLEYLVGEAIWGGHDTIITAGAAQSNHCRQTAAAAAMCGLECHLILGGAEPKTRDGNLLLDDLVGAKIHWNVNRKGDDLEVLAKRLRAQGKDPYVIPYGGSNAIGALGYVNAARELKHQMLLQEIKFTHVVIASSSGGTHAGLTVGKTLYGIDLEIIGIEIDKSGPDELPFHERVLRCTNDTAKLLELNKKFRANDLHFENGYLGGGYGVVGNLERNAIRTLARLEGILVDPVYTGRAFGAMIDMIKNDKFSKNDKVLFWHTGGGPALFPYASDILK